jgi:hypothetical protein
MVFVLTAFMPLAAAAWRHDDRCCSNGVCCCRPKSASADCCVRSACPCGGHDQHGASLPAEHPFEVAGRFSLAIPSNLRDVAAPAAAGLDDGFLPLLDHPPDRALTAAC